MRTLMALLLTSVAAGQSGWVTTNTFTSASTFTLKQRIDAVYELSARQCAVSFSGEEGCIAKQFALNYRWEITQDQPRWVGAPSVPTRGVTYMTCPTGPTGPLGPLPVKP